MMEEPRFDPYRTPQAADSSDPDIAALGELVRAWEKLRLLYNGIMILPGLGVLALWISRANLPIPVAIVFAIIVGLGANTAFFLGPLAELYLRALFRRGEGIGKGRWLIFSAGLVVSAAVVLFSCVIPVFWPQG
ncbi:MAG: hypothetical protein ABIT37_12460 [Luteolibacter sp.]